MKLRGLNATHYDFNQALIEFQLEDDEEELHRFLSYAGTFFAGWLMCFFF